MNKNTTLSLIIGSLLVLGTIGSVLVLTYNGLVTGEKRVEEAKAQVQVLCQRRLDLIPNLVKTVKAYAQHERETLTAVTAARSKMQDVLKEIAVDKSINKEQMARLTTSESELNRSLMPLFALVEQYPSLKASANFATLQHQLEGTENRISIARQRYNSHVRIYNTKTDRFPSNIVAYIFGFEETDFFEPQEESQEAVKVDF